MASYCAEHLDIVVVYGNGSLVQDPGVGKARLLCDAQEVVDVKGPRDALPPDHLRPRA